MKLEPISANCYAILHGRNRLCDANSGYLSSSGGGLLIDTQSDLRHARQLGKLIGQVEAAPVRYVVNTHEDADHVWGNQVFSDAQIIAHQSVPARMDEVADPNSIRKLVRAVDRLVISSLLGLWHPGLQAVGKQLKEDYDFSGIRLTYPTVLFEDRLELDVNGIDVHIIHLGPAHQWGDSIVHVPQEGVVFCGDLVFSESIPMGWAGTHQNWLAALDRIEALNPNVIVPGHGPLCGLVGLRQMRSYLEHVWQKSKECFERGLKAVDAAKQIELHAFRDWHAPARVYMTVERNYRELQGQPFDAPWDLPSTFDAIHEVASARGVPTEF